MFRGLFIGVDRYRSAKINWLSGARRDAVALHALFADTLGGECELLADDQATRANILAKLDRLASCNPDDLVVIAFSGHGSVTHELVVNDTEVHDLTGTGIPLDELAALLAKIPARRLVLFLDCCFSGGMEARVLQVEAVARDLKSVDTRLDALAGEGRLIVTASAANEPAWENPRTGHGYFTHFLLEALLGPPGVVENDALPFYRLLEYVTRRVMEAAHLFGRVQRPTLRGKVDGEIKWPIFVPGPRYREAFPDRSAARAQADVASLAAFGFPAALLGAWGQAIPTLNQLQLDAINDYGVLQGEHLVVVAPTSSGKTMVGELAALKAVSNRQRALFLLPLKALVADKRRHFQAVYGAYGLRTLEATGETDDIAPLLRGQYDLALLTYEKFAAIALTNPHVLAQVGTIIVDEVQMLADKSRGANLEFLLTLIRMRRQDGIEPQLIALSGVIGETGGLEHWLGAKLLRRNERPVPLDEGLILGDGSFRFISADSGKEEIRRDFIQRIYQKDSSQDYVIPLVAKLVSEGKQVIVFRETKGETRGCALYLGVALGLPPADQALRRLPQGDLSRASHDLRQALEHGVSFHNADLDREERRVVEEEFRRRDGTVRVIVATTTLAMGVNTPANAVVVVGLTHPPDQPYSVSEYKNLVGRAGRLGYAERGESYLLAFDPRTEHEFWQNYVTGRPEDLKSRFLDRDTDPRSIIVRVLAATRKMFNRGLTDEQVVAFLEGSFGAFQERQRREQWQWDPEILRRALVDLERHGLVERLDGNLLHLTPLGLVAGETAAQVSSIVRLVDCFRALTPGEISDPVLITAVQVTEELDQQLVPLNRRSTLKEPQAWSAALVRQGVPNSVLHSLARSAQDTNDQTMRQKRAVACLLFVSGQEMTDIEQTLTQFGGAFGGAAGPVRAIAARTSDLLPAAVRVAQLLHPTLDLESRSARLLTRLANGVDGEAVQLAQIAGADLQRGDYRRLAAAGLCDGPRILAAADAAILVCVDDDPARLALVRRAAESLIAAIEPKPPVPVPLYQP
jgi:replicative superfamily II helicase